MDAGDHASADFKALGLRLYPAHAPLLITYLYLKQHTAKETGGAVPGAVFVTGLPLGLDESSLRAVFGCFGDVAQVVLHATKRSGVVVFSDEDGAQAALEHAGAGEIVEYELPPPEGPFGLKAWVAEHKAQRPGNAVLQKQIDDWITNWEAEEEERRRQQEAAVTEEGWTVVVRSKGRKREREGGGAVSGGVALAAAQAAAEAKEKSKQKYDDFYRFQRRDKRRSELVGLQKKFEEDRRRIAELRQARRFKPC